MPGNGDGAHKVWLTTLTPPMSSAVAVLERPHARDQLIQLPDSRALASQPQLFGKLGQYRLLQPIGNGGTSLVYRAAGPDDRMVAVKALRLPAAGNAEARSRLSIPASMQH
jgi:hypothetical protein